MATHFPGASPPPRDASPSPILGLFALMHGLFSGILWSVFLVVVGIIGKSMGRTGLSNGIIGLSTIGGMLANFVGTVCGIIAAFRSNEKFIGIAGAVLNALDLIAISALLLFGLSLKH